MRFFKNHGSWIGDVLMIVGFSLAFGAVTQATGCATGDPAVDARRTDSSIRICKASCAMGSAALYRRCAQQPAVAEVEICDEQVLLGIDACLASCEGIEIDGMIGGIDVGGD